MKQDLIFKFDRVFDPSDSQDQVQEEVEHLVTSCLDGYNVCILAYGQTGSGKTYTMIGDDNHNGLYQYAINQIFTRLEEGGASLVTDQRLRISIVEIYNEQIRDLLPKKSGDMQQT